MVVCSTDEAGHWFVAQICWVTVKFDGGMLVPDENSVQIVAEDQNSRSLWNGW